MNNELASKRIAFEEDKLIRENTTTTTTQQQTSIGEADILRKKLREQVINNNNNNNDDVIIITSYGINISFCSLYSAVIPYRGNVYRSPFLREYSVQAISYNVPSFHNQSYKKIKHVILYMYQYNKTTHIHTFIYMYVY